MSSAFRHAVKKTLAITSMGVCASLAQPALAGGGISIQGTRVIYPQNAEQVSLSIINSSPTDSFLVQSWVEDASGHKTADFIVTPPLYLSGPKNENALRIIHTGGTLPTDRETLYYFTARAIPSIDDNNKADKDILHFALASRIKLFVRPSGLKPSPAMAPALVDFHQQGSELIIHNTSPYYLTLTAMTSGGKALKDLMVSPLGTATESLPAGHGSTVTYRTVNDYGTITPAIETAIK
ncbi:hypothetical protein AW879_12635 [Enterobacter cloacae]|nr:fimbria/pilus periplasmic chaperone [Enterobacter cloacae]AMJ70710.1 hypothetical protein AW879_12635 [Enterobacter cloacae]EJC0563353.1 fimbria/pilus periplasmic chaperone [Enterobacter cloacae]